jgi:hypothetical protein
MFKYTLIVSQYYHSRHFFIVKHTEDFIEKARLFALDLFKLKRSEGHFVRECQLGDLDPKYIGDPNVIKSRYNINDAGDIYFIQGNHANHCMNVANEYHETSVLQGRGRISKAVLNDVSKHHNYYDVKNVVEKHFEII